MKLGNYRVVYNAHYNYRAIHKKKADRWTVEEQGQVTFFGMCRLWDYWSEHTEPGYDSDDTIYFNSPKEAFAYVERLLNGNPRNTTVTTVVTEINHERIN